MTEPYFHTADTQHHVCAFCPIFPTRDSSRRDGAGLTSPLGVPRRALPRVKAEQGSGAGIGYHPTWLNWLRSLPPGGRGIGKMAFVGGKGVPS